MHTSHFKAAAGVVVLTALACSGPFEVGDSFGEWGGEGIVAMIEIDAATFEFDCAHAAVPAGIVFGEDGSFEVGGVWIAEGGPLQLEPPPVELEAVFRGRIRGESMSLEVDIIPRDVTAGPYDLRRGRSGQLRKCL